MTQRVSIAENDFTVPSQTYLEGAKPSWIITVPGVSVITDDATLSMKVYKGSNDKSSDYTTGSMAVSGNKITTKTMQNLVGKDELYVSIWATMDGVYDCVCAFKLSVRSLSGK